ncbi:unnamed protein product [Vitrella brassicaformis CCMP3155]|uniref:Uncharacterized protein n=1 Tax=Vitrella brassicaformis (strain CCMP3155) TaxID=1169540 RepID=A0A0G4H1G9_VITBC|nr:unnamed protein product [Vitrella brassicaformis CCMP3155]|eukprot:CEM37311.1 unnamed protein product [Vitrella brassicaformis CCMP3155]
MRIEIRGSDDENSSRRTPFVWGSKKDATNEGDESADESEDDEVSKCPPCHPARGQVACGLWRGGRRWVPLRHWLGSL